MMRRALAIAALVVALSSCAASAPPPSSPGTPPAGTSAPPGELVLPEPGRPLDGTTLLSAMRESRRPGGVPDELETDDVAAAAAAAIWTFDGEPWSSLSVSGSCGPRACTLEISGSSEGAQGDDLWVFEIAPGGATASLVSADVRSLPPDLIVSLDGLARSLLPADRLEGTNLASVRWLPPPDEDGSFVLSYRSGGEEGSCGVDVTMKASAREITSVRELDCG